MNTMDPIRDEKVVEDIGDYLRVRNERDYVMFMFGLYTGLRISDILLYRVRDVKEKDYIYMREKKKGKERKLVIHEDLKEIIKDYIKDKEDYEFLFKSRKGLNKPIKRETAYSILKNAANAFGLECIGTHTMRKTYGYFIYIHSDRDPIVTKEALNHSDINTTLRYIGIKQDIVNKAAMKLSFTSRKKRK